MRSDREEGDLTRKYLTVRREKNRQLAVQEAAARCTWCRSPLKPGFTLRLADRKVFCNAGCQDDDEEWTACKEVRR